MSCDLAKLDLFGADYIFEVFTELAERQVLDVYLTDVLKCTLESVVAMGGGKVELPRFYDVIQPKEKKKEKSPEEIIKDFAIGLGLA